MSQDSSQSLPEDRSANRTMLRRALATMSSEQLDELKSTAHRLKHLPFTRLVEVLFTEADEEPGNDPVHTEHKSPKHNFAGDSAGECRSDFLRDLFEEIDRALALR